MTMAYHTAVPMSLLLERASTAVAPSAVCANCGAPGAGDFCPQCGQRRVEDDDLSVRHVAAHVTGELLDVDGRYLTTIKLLLTKPGQLTVDYIEGRRVRHVPPLRLFLFVSASISCPRRGPWRASSCSSSRARR